VRTVWGEVLPFYPAPTTSKHDFLSVYIVSQY